jgi:hypothetical protein
VGSNPIARFSLCQVADGGSVFADDARAQYLVVVIVFGRLVSSIGSSYEGAGE